METFREKIVDLTSGEQSFRDYDENEIAAIYAVRQRNAEIFLEMEKAIANKKALLAKLGLTAEEAETLLS